MTPSPNTGCTTLSPATNFCTELLEALRAEEINRVCLIAFAKNDVGNAFWNKTGWKKRQDTNFYDFILNEENITAFNEE